MRPTSQASQANAAPAVGLEKLDKWRTAVAQHEAGTLDDAALGVSAWSITELSRVITDLKGLAKLLFESRTRARGSLEQHWLGVTDEEAERGDANRVLKRGALLLTDIALLAPAREVAVSNGTSTLVRVEDGRVVGRSAASHWEFARALLDSVHPDPARDETVRQWYVATTACLQSRRHWGTVKPHLAYAKALFPTDTNILLYSAVLHENLAGPTTQNFLRTAPPGIRFDVGSEKPELELAKALFEEVIKADPKFAEAHLHIGRVTGLLGDHTQAVAALQRAAALMTDPQLLYYAALFLGREQEMLGHYEAAREQFSRAAWFYPTAQSPLLALSRLARSDGDAEGARDAMERALTLQVSQDPWWTYDVAHVRNADALMTEMLRAFGGLPR